MATTGDQSASRPPLSPARQALLEQLKRAALGSSGVEPVIPRRPDPGPAPLAFAQQRLWFLAQLDPDSAAYNTAIDQRLTGALDVGALAQSLDAIVRRQEVLRATFTIVNGQPQQVIAPAAPLRLPIVDLRALPEHERRAELRRLAIAEARRPFDLEHGPLLRATLVRMEPEAHVLLLTTHHIVFDGSYGVFLRELMTAYNAFSAGAAPQLPELPIQYADFAHWQRQRLTDEALEAQRSYWVQQLGDDLTPLQLPTDRPRPAFQTFRGAKQPIDLSPQLTQALESLSRAEAVTLFMTMLAAFQTLLSRYTSQEKISVGTPVADRSRVETESLVGCFVNTVVLRADLSGNPCFRELLRRVRQVALGAQAHQDFPFEMLVEALQQERDPSRNPLYQVMFVLQQGGQTSLDLAGLTMSALEIDSGTARFDLLFSMWKDEERLRGIMEYNSDLFDSTTIARMLRHFQTLLEGIAADPDRRIWDLPLLTEPERRQLLVDWNDTAADYRQDCCIHQLFEQQAEQAPDAVAVVFDPTTTGDKETRRQGDKETRRQGEQLPLSPQSSFLSPSSLTYGELNRQANQLAHHLRSLGVGPGTMVAIFMDRSLELIPALLGILKAGGTYVPLEVSYPRARVQWILSSLGVRWVITQSARLGQIDALREGVPTLVYAICLDAARAPAPIADGQEATRGAALRIWTRADLDRAPRDNPPPLADPDHLAYVIFTSGSTGTPKGVMVSHRPVINLIEWVNRGFGIGPSDRLLFITSICFDLSVYDVFGLLAAGGTIQVVADQDTREPEQLLHLLDAEPITFWDSAPAALQQLAPFFPAARSSQRRSRLRLVFLSGDWIPVTLPDRVRAAFPGAEVISLGGATEATVWSNYYPIRTVEPSWPSIPYGRPIQNARYYILDSRLNPCPIGVPGALYIGGACLASGYANDPALTAEKFIPNPFADQSGTRDLGLGTRDQERDLKPLATSHKPQAPSPKPHGERLYRTGDQARFWPDGTIEFLGRIDQQVKIRGFRIELGEIETVLAQHAAVREALVLAREDSPGDRRLVAYVVPATDKETRRQAGKESGRAGERESDDKVTRRAGDGETGDAADPQSSALSTQHSAPPSSFILHPSSLTVELRAFLQDRLPEYMVPSAFVTLDALPLTSNGKVDRRALPAPDPAHTAPATIYVAPRTPIEQILAGIYADVLRVKQVGIHESFFDLGGHSLSATRVTSHVRDALQVDLPLRALFENPTVGGLAHIIEQIARGAGDVQEDRIESMPLAEKSIEQLLAEIENLSDDVEQLSDDEVLGLLG